MNSGWWYTVKAKNEYDASKFAFLNIINHNSTFSSIQSSGFQLPRLLLVVYSSRPTSCSSQVPNPATVAQRTSRCNLLFKRYSPSSISTLQHNSQSVQVLFQSRHQTLQFRLSRIDRLCKRHCFGNSEIRNELFELSMCFNSRRLLLRLIAMKASAEYQIHQLERSPLLPHHQRTSSAL